MTKKALVFTMQKVGSSSAMRILESRGFVVDRGYEENIVELAPISSYDFVVTLVRDPIARNISWFFEKFGLEVLQNNLRNEQIYLLFMENINHKYPLTWFDKVFRLATQLDVYVHPPYVPRGIYEIWRTDELPDHRADTMLTRPYGAMYQNFLDWVKLPKSYTSLMYNSKFAKHFFLEDELLDWRKRWEE